MKINILRFFLFVTFSSFTYSQESKTIQKSIIKTTLNCDHCIQCETCGKNLNKELYKIKGLKMLEIDETNMNFIVFYNPKKTTLQTIKNKISELGFDADYVKADPTGYEKLDNCCKKN